MEAGSSRPKRDRSESPRRASGQEESSGGSGARTKKHKAESPQEALPVRSPSPEGQQLPPIAQPYDEQWSREAQPMASKSSPTRSPMQRWDNYQWQREVLRPRTSRSSSEGSLMHASDPLPPRSSPALSYQGRWTADAVRDDANGVYTFMYQKQLMEKPAVAKPPRSPSPEGQQSPPTLSSIKSYMLRSDPLPRRRSPELTPRQRRWTAEVAYEPPVDDLSEVMEKPAVVGPPRSPSPEGQQSPPEGQRSPPEGQRSPPEGQRSPPEGEWPPDEQSTESTLSSIRSYMDRKRSFTPPKTTGGNAKTEEADC